MITKPRQEAVSKEGMFFFKTRGFKLIFFVRVFKQKF